MKFLIFSMLLLGLVSCYDDHADHHKKEDKSHHDEKLSQKEDGHDEHHDHDHGHHHGPGGHTHGDYELKAPNGGALTKLGGDAAVLEVLLDNKIGEMKIYLFDGEAKNQLKIEQKKLNLVIKDLTIALTADEEGVFRVANEKLKGLQKFDAEVAALEIEGLPFDGVTISYPEGN